MEQHSILVGRHARRYDRAAHSYIRGDSMAKEFISLKQAEQLYQAMTTESEPHEDDPDKMVWEGFLTHLLDDLGIGKTKYGKLVRLLQDMGCIEQLKRGAGSSPSYWLLIGPPTEEGYKYLLKTEEEKPEQKSPIEQRVDNLQAIVMDLADEVKELTWYVSTLDQNQSNSDQPSKST